MINRFEMMEKYNILVVTDIVVLVFITRVQCAEYYTVYTVVTIAAGKPVLSDAGV